MSTKSARPKTGAKPHKGSGSGPSSARPEGDPLTRRMLRAAFADRGSELLGLCLVLGGLLAGLSIYFDRAGVVGRVVDDAASWSVGLTKLVLPVSMVLLGFAMFRERYEFGEITKRMPVGGVLCLAGLTGLFHLGRDTPGIDDGADALGGAGGLIGLGVGGGLDAAVARWGAVLILVGIVLVGLAVVTRTTARQAAVGTVKGLRPVGRAVGDAFRSLLTPPGDPDAPVLRVPETAPPVPEPATEPESTSTGMAAEEATDPKRRRKKRTAPVGIEQTGEQLTIELGPATAGSPWKLPTTRGLARRATHDVDAKAVEERGARLVEALLAHGVETRLVDMTVGPTVTRYALQVAEGVKVSRITNLAKDIAYELAAADVRILAPIPGQRAIGIEVPNEEREIVVLGDILASTEAAKATHPLEAAIGRDINGRPVMLNLATMPHILIAGATGSGKSSCINALVTSILVRSTPDQVRLILIDPKRVEMGQYEGVPHLLTAPVTDPKKAANALHWAVREMERRYTVLSTFGFRDIGGYNAAFDRGDLRGASGAGRRGRGAGHLSAPAVHPRGRRRAGRPDDGGRPRRRGLHLSPGTDGPGGRHPPGGGHPATIGQHHHRRHQGQHPGPSGIRRLQPCRQQGDPRPAGRRTPGRQGRHAPAGPQFQRRTENPGCMGGRKRGPTGSGVLGGPGARHGESRRGRGARA